MSIQVKKQSLPQRCEVCHQSDCYNAETNYCFRCGQLAQQRLLTDGKTPMQYQNVYLTVLRRVLMEMLICISSLCYWPTSLLGARHARFLAQIKQDRPLNPEESSQ